MFTGKMWTLAHFPLRLACEDYVDLDQTVEDFEHGVDSNSTDFFNPLLLNASSKELDVITSSVSSVFLNYNSTLSDSSKLHLATRVKSNILWCQASVLLSLAGRTSSSKLIYYFSSHLAVFGFWAAILLDKIALNCANKRSDQSLSDL